MKDRVILSSFNHKTVKRCKNIDKSIKTAILYEKQIDNIINYANSLDVDAINPSISLVSKELIEEAHKKNLKVNVYTVNSPIYMRNLIEANVDGIFTDCFHLLKEILEK